MITLNLNSFCNTTCLYGHWNCIDNVVNSNGLRISEHLNNENALIELYSNIWNGCPFSDGISLIYCHQEVLLKLIFLNEMVLSS